jgi:seryl-tRNA synthetase
MVQETDYTVLHDRLNKALQNRAVLAAKEEEAKKERDRLAAELTAQGIDITKPAEEVKRLEALILEDYEEQKNRIDQFEKELQNAMTGVTPTPTGSVSDLDFT